MNILLLEDNCTELQILYNILKKHWPQFHYTCCQNYNDAQKSILSVQYDIFILDIQLSSASDAFNGITFARYIRSLPAYRTTPVLFSTGTSDTIQKCVNEVHCYHYLEKPYNEAVLVHAMKELLTTLSNTTDNNYLTIKLLNDVTTHVCLSNILLIKANGHYLTFTCPDSGFTSNTYSLLLKYFHRISPAATENILLIQILLHPMTRPTFICIFIIILFLLGERLKRS